MSAIRLLSYPSPRVAGIYPIGVEIRFGTEPTERLDAALQAGWALLAGIADPPPDTPKAA